MNEKPKDDVERERAKTYLQRRLWFAPSRRALGARSGLRYGGAGEPIPFRIRVLGTWGGLVVGIAIVIGVPLAMWWLSAR